ncbi:hypothetical protein SBRY_120023 [Actinacidiphila bryophytorum]|uniref:Uncharacterized protein n=1 Tax=Actinacidiphila bryophytorum TaxID=1436133 RepID=A0A9W4GXC1_9ACTN|nr:hypothetical protein SBRY_120023 [Actinacidiphila bryophytorum]
MFSSNSLITTSQSRARPVPGARRFRPSAIGGAGVKSAPRRGERGPFAGSGYRSFGQRLADPQGAAGRFERAVVSLQKLPAS